MKSTLSLQVDTDLLLQLIEQLRRLGGSQDVSDGISTAIAYWLARQANAGDAAITEPDYPRGYQWKSLFLPEGTVLRSWSYGEHNYAHVDGDRIIHCGRAVTPNQFAQSFACSTRNAWRDVFVRRPGDKQFRLASQLRRELATQETPALKTQPAPMPQAGTLGAMLAALLSSVPVGAGARPSAMHASPPAAVHASSPTSQPASQPTSQPAVEPTVEPAVEPTVEPAAEPPSAPVRDTTPGPGWTLPERRKLRYRLEDVAFE